MIQIYKVFNYDHPGAKWLEDQEGIWHGWWGHIVADNYDGAIEISLRKKGFNPKEFMTSTGIAKQGRVC
jgi:hypothetical protein